ncbi:hypothetical protein [Gordonia hydrophobica]|uniref:Uncharacterized protein n=1 Tax=Gordonia hydrophobica TaxID=40516 RepID=A0ABZ2U3L8_9ACTN|nr:hypothetical protein [Gordonia hydrophobica]MBM7367683.1 hypothetical protein [Gordonia hydrophobica]
MLAVVVIVPSAPLLVPELAGPDAADTDAVRAAVHAATERSGRRARRWLAIGAADVGGQAIDPGGYRRTGDFGAYGVPVPVSLGAGDAGRTPLPLSMLIAGWVNGLTEPLSDVTPIVVDPTATPEQCRAVGETLAADIADTAEPVGVLVVADGANALTASAPGGGERVTAVALQERIDAALAHADVPALRALTAEECTADGAGGRPAWQVLAGLCDGTDLTSTVDYAGAPFGVGYTVAVWTPTGAGA